MRGWLKVAEAGPHAVTAGFPIILFAKVRKSLATSRRWQTITEVRLATLTTRGGETGARAWRTGVCECEKVEL